MNTQTRQVSDLNNYLYFPIIHVEVLEGPDKGKAMELQQGLMVIGNPKVNLSRSTRADDPLHVDFELTDPKVSHQHLSIRRDMYSDTDQYLIRDLDSKNGTWIQGIKIREAYLTKGMEVQVGDTLLRFQGEVEKQVVSPIYTSELEGMVGHSTAMKRLFSQIQRAARSDSTVLILGDTGTGKELVARAIFALSTKYKKRLEVVDCSALPNSERLDSELFGHKQGAFTGADEDYVGAFVRGDGGTVFIDEIGELPKDSQTYFLGALERRQVRPLRSENYVDFDARVIAATNRDLLEMVETGDFRQDLYYRLAVFEIYVPPLMERGDDVEHLFEHFCQLELAKRNEENPGTAADLPEIPPDIIHGLRSYSWPGNVRELKYAVESAFAKCPDEFPSLDDFPRRIRSAIGKSPMLSTTTDIDYAQTYDKAKESAISQFQRDYFSHLLEQYQYNISEVARNADVTRKVIYEVMKEHNIKKPEK